MNRKIGLFLKKYWRIILRKENLHNESIIDDYRWYENQYAQRNYTRHLVRGISVKQILHSFTYGPAQAWLCA